MKQEYDFSKGERGKFFREDVIMKLPPTEVSPKWAGPSEKIGKFINQEAQNSLSAYRQQPKLILEHARLEQDTAKGGYAHRQLFELVQNSADALLDSEKAQSILVRLTEEFLYCADNGDPIDEEGVEGLMFDRMSSKRNTNAIGRFGRGFKSVLRVTDSPEFFSRSGSFRFDRKRSEERIAQIASIESYPVLRLPESIDPREEQDKDAELRELMSWATNIVRLPLIPGMHGELAQQIEKFPPEFLLFVDHVRYLTLEDEKSSRTFVLHRKGQELRLNTGKECASWRRFVITHRLSDDARADWHLHGDGNKVNISWAAPLDRLDRPGNFWAFFPTETTSLVAGILNAPWKTNEDRQNLLPGQYNKELIDAAANMIAKNLSDFATHDDPARHLDALPRRHEKGDSIQVDYLRERLFSCLEGRKIVPDQNGEARGIEEIAYTPKELTDGLSIHSLQRWVEYPEHPRDWLHHAAVTRNRRHRIAAINWLFPPPRWGGDDKRSAPWGSIHSWLEALVKNKEGDAAILASIAAINIAATITPKKTFSNEDFGRIVLTANGNWKSPNPEYLFLSNATQNNSNVADLDSLVHPKLTSESETLLALKKLGLKRPSPESRFEFVARSALERKDSELDEGLFQEFWITSRTVSSETALKITKSYKNRGGAELWRLKLRVRTKAGNWMLLQSVLLPGTIVVGDGCRDEDVIVDTEFHRLDNELLHGLGATEVPLKWLELSAEPYFLKYLEKCRSRFINRDLEKNPHTYRLVFQSSKGCGPLDVMNRLSDEGCAAYTDALLSLDSSFSQWTMYHETQGHLYPELLCDSLTVEVIRKFGRIRTPSGATIPFADALGPTPRNSEGLHALLLHPSADKIKQVFKLAEPIPEIYGEGDAIPVIDVWPGLKEYLPTHRMQCRIVPCEKICVISQSRECVFHAPNVFLVGAVQGDCPRELRVIVDELGLALTSKQVNEILLRKTSAEIEEHRAAVRQGSTDAERLLIAVGVDNLRRNLPSSLLGVLEKGDTKLSRAEIAEVAIATFHTDALRQYKWALDRLGPPSQWAGYAPAVEFVQSLGFSLEWAGERRGHLDPYLEIEGRYRLPELHPYQTVVVRNIVEMLRGNLSDKKAQHGMVSLPTGSGKTRVVVQAVVEAIRDGDFVGGVLWVADRSELCEQAVEAWRQVWSGIGPQESILRISRMWERQPNPLPKTELHVVVATIQTLNSKLSNGYGEFDFLKKFKLVIFDEAHRSIAPSFTSVMKEIGLTRRQDSDEPSLIGLTATPYRGFDEDETKRLANRYGSNRLEQGAFKNDDAGSVIKELQSMGVLALADHEIIEGETFSLDDILKSSAESENWENELEKWLALPWLPQSVEDQIAQNTERTERIIEAYRKHINPNWSTLIFATSVEHAQTVAALLNRNGIRSRAVSGGTNTSTRRRIVEEFRCGEIKALVNYGVFREGFDAPKTRAIIVARPVYSPNLYFQMIGRGLRGQRNGGNERCLILNVRDNIDNFDRSLAFTELDWLWA